MFRTSLQLAAVLALGALISVLLVKAEFATLHGHPVPTAAHLGA